MRSKRWLSSSVISNECRNLTKQPFSSSRMTLWDWPSGVQTIIAALTAGGSVFGWQWNRKRRLKKTFVDNVVETLEKPFEPPFAPKYGPVFHRKDWEHKFLHLCDTEAYMLYHGASQVGISLAVVQALKDRRGVAYLNLRGAEPQKVSNRLAAAIGYAGKEIPHGGNVNLDTDTLMMVLGDAARRLNEKKIKPVIVIEDIQTGADLEKGQLPAPTSTIVCGLIDLHIAGLVNTVYTANDFNAIKCLTAESGHSRLRTTLFPLMSDDALASMLAQLTMNEPDESFDGEDQQVKQHQQQIRKFNFLPRAGSSAVCAAGHRFVLSEEEAKRIVEKLGSHMGDVTACLRHMIEEGKSVDAAIDSIVSEQVTRFYTAFPEEVQLQKPEYLVASDRILSLLAHKSDKESLKWVSAYDGLGTTLPFAQLVAAVSYLARKNILSYSNPESICFHSRALKWAYLDLCTRETWKRSVEGAAALLVSRSK